MLHRTIGLILIALAVASVSVAQDGQFRMQLFSAPEVRVAAVGDDFQFVVEGVAVAEREADAQEMISAFRSLAFPGTEERGFSVVRADPPQISRRARTSIYQVEKRFTLRVADERVLEIPSLSLNVAGSSFTTRPQIVRGYQRSEALLHAARSVVPILAEGLFGSRDLRRAGSAFLIAEDAIVTSYHVIVDVSQVRVTLPNGREIVTKKV
ncbi:MAG: S1C family serine protease, partial [Rubricoccaceae bacterium]|nr:S1C family serine protease [Rubricoccaceae bacterium]